LRKFVKTASRAAAGPTPVPMDLNEPMFDYAPGSPERIALYDTVAKIHSTTKDIPLIIGGEEIYDAQCGKTSKTSGIFKSIFFP